MATCYTDGGCGDPGSNAGPVVEEPAGHGDKEAGPDMNPLARTEGLVVRELSDELVVYDTTSHHAHYLNATAAFVFRHANGRRSVRDLAALLPTGGADAGEGLLRSAVEQLAEAGLLAPEAPTGPVRSRREVLRQVGIGAALLAPVVTSLLVPTPAEAAATCIPVTSCTDSNIGQPCWNSNPGTECSTKTCQGATTCA
jgi:hypothetical protein